MAKGQKCTKIGCIACVYEKCAVEQCKGPIYRTTTTTLPVKVAERLYNACNDYFEKWRDKK